MLSLDPIPYGPRYHYPHMKPNDVAIWQRFLANNPNAFEAVQYDVAVGSGTELNTVVNPDTGGDVNALYQRKIDVVAIKESQIFVIEIKPRAGPSTIGQVKGYMQLLKRDYKLTVPINGVIVTDSLLPDMEFLTKAEQVAIVVV